MQSFWFRIDSLLQKRPPAASAGGGAGEGEGAKGDYLAGDKDHPNWPRSGKARAPAGIRSDHPQIRGSEDPSIRRSADPQ